MDEANEKEPLGWGHVTCDGSVANLESIWAGALSCFLLRVRLRLTQIDSWVARNLKFYPLSLRLAMKKELSFVADTFHVRTCAESEESPPTKLLKDFTTWELLNITPSEVLDIPTRLNRDYGITPAFLQKALDPYSVQTLGKDTLERKYDIKPMAYFASATMHYSWPKGAGMLKSIMLRY